MMIMSNQRNKKLLLFIDGVINLFLGGILLLYPTGIQEFLGLPPVIHHFYTTILGGVIFGIGLALFIETYLEEKDIKGLGLAGAIAINLCGGGVLLVWLIAKPFTIPIRGLITLWIVAILVVGIGFIELITKSWRE
jgi:hypothetical protein